MVWGSDAIFKLDGDLLVIPQGHTLEDIEVLSIDAPRTVTVNSSEVSQALQQHMGSIVQTVRSVLERTPPELASDVIDRGIVLTGGGALLRHLDELLRQETGVPVHVAENALHCVALGAGAALDYLDVIERAMPTEEESLISETG